MTTVNDLYPSQYLKASDVSHEPVVTIARIEKEEMKNQEGKKELKPVLYFVEFEKGMVLNRTNANLIANLYGEDLDDWKGCRVQLHTPDVEGFGKVQPAIRIKSQKPPADKKSLLDAFQKLYERAQKANVDGLSDYVVSPSMTEQEIIDLGKELKTKVLAAEAF